MRPFCRRGALGPDATVTLLMKWKEKGTESAEQPRAHVSPLAVVPTEEAWVRWARSWPATKPACP